MPLRDKHSKTLAPTGRPKGYATYVVFSVTAPKEHLGMRIKLVRVDSRNLAELKIPKDAYEFYFCDGPANVRDPLADETNLSRWYVVAKEIIPRDALRSRLIEKGVILENPPAKVERDKDGNLPRDIIRHSVWSHKADSAPWHAIARGGEIIPLTDHWKHIVIDAKKRVMIEWGDAKPRIADAALPDAPRPKPRAPEKRVVFKP